MKFDEHCAAIAQEISKARSVTTPSGQIKSIDVVTHIKKAYIEIGALGIALYLLVYWTGHGAQKDGYWCCDDNKRVGPEKILPRWKNFFD